MKDEDERESAKVPYDKASIRTESHVVYELKQQREYLIQKLVNVQKAIDAINKI